MFQNLYLLYVTDKLTYEIRELGDGRYSVEVMFLNIQTLGILYFENPKQRWYNKPIGSTKLRCVDAKVEGLYIHGGENLTPKDIVAKCQDELERYIQDRGIDMRPKKNED
jgi:hypothetical protein